MGRKIDQEVIHRIAHGTASDLDHKIFNEWLSTLDATAYEKVLDEFENLAEPFPDDRKVNSDLWEKISLKVNVHDALTTEKKETRFPWLAIVASLALITSITLYLTTNWTDNSFNDISKVPFEQRLSNDILPGKNQAYLELADGSKIILDESAPAKIWEESGVLVTKSGEGKLVYDFAGTSELTTADPAYHTISTPKGGEYQLILPDGTKVWLNASSHLKFPTVFDGNERKVELSGEAYFDVVSNKERPFVVQTTKETVHVLGTKFNMSSYPDENSSRTTLLEGEVKISPKNTSNRERTLSPGQQSIIQGDRIKIAEVNVDEVVSWKNGEFMFNRESIESVMRRIARWYDVEVIYKTPIGNDVKIWGTVSRFDNISEVLKFIEGTKVVYFKVEGRKVYVMK